MAHAAPPTSILSFPDELLIEISQNAASRTTLRLVCQRFNQVITPGVFSSITIRYRYRRLAEYVNVLKALAVGTHPALYHAKTVTISHLSPARFPGHFYNGLFVPMNSVGNNRYLYKVEELDPYLSNWQSISDLLGRAISGFRRVAKIRWTVHYLSSHCWSRKQVIAGMSQLNSLEDLELDVNLDERTSIQIQSLPPLRGLKIKLENHSSNLSDDPPIQGIPELIAKSFTSLREFSFVHSFSASHEGIRVLPSINEFLTDAPQLHLTHLTLDGALSEFCEDTISHLYFLESFCFTNGNGGPWRAFFDKRIYLQHITLDDPTESFVDYLKSYSGLETLAIKGTSDARSNFLAEDFYRNVLRCHQSSLEVLEVTPAYEGKWYFGDHAVKPISRLSSLKQLSLSVVADPILPTPPTSRNSGFARGLLRRENQNQEPRYDMFHPICTLLKTASSLPNLQSLTITEFIHPGVIPEIFREANYASRLAIQINTHVTSFGPLERSRYRFDVKFYEKCYTLQQLESGEYWYRELGGVEKKKWSDKMRKRIGKLKKS